MVDFKKAFDLVNHNLLLQKLILSGVPHFLIKWVFSYLQHIFKRVRIGTNHSSYSQLNGAMPQGSWLRPLSFLVLINDLKPDRWVHKYVDDTTLTELLYDRTKPSSMQSFFHQLLSWAYQNDMVVNLAKLKKWFFGPPAIASNLPPISASSYQIQRASEAKPLGVHIDSNLSWHTHVEAIVSKQLSDWFLKQLNRAGVQNFTAPSCFTSIFQSSVLSWNMQSLFGITSSPKLRR